MNRSQSRCSVTGISTGGGINLKSLLKKKDDKVSIESSSNHHYNYKQRGTSGAGSIYSHKGSEDMSYYKT